MPAAEAADEEDRNASFYGEDIFDDLIAKAMDPTAGGDTSPSKMETAFDNDERVVVEGTPANLENSEEGGGGDDFSTGGSDADVASLDSGEITGESDISEAVEEPIESYNPSPLVNDDESTIDMRPPAPNNQTVSSYVDQLNRSERSKGRLIKGGAFAICIAIVVGVILAVISLTGDSNDDINSITSQVSTPGVPTAPVDQTSLAPAIPIPAPVVPAPTMKPVMATRTETVHPVQLTFENVPAGYRLAENDRTSIINFIRELLGDHLDDSFELLGVAYARDSGGRYRRLNTGSFSLPLVLVLRGSSNFSEEFVRSYVIEKIQERSTNIVNYLKAYNWKTFNNVRISAVETYDIADLIDPTVSPSLSPITGQPTTSPSLPYRTGEPTASPSLPPQTELPTSSPSRSPETFTQPLNTENKPTKNPTRRPSQNPTLRPTWTPRPTPSPTPRPTPIPTPRPTPNPTPRPSLRPTRRPTNKPVTSIISPYGAADPASNPTPAAANDDSVNQGPGWASTPSGPSNGYFCAETSYTANWNILLDFKCDLACPSKAHAECPGGHQCHTSDYCDEQNNGR